MNNNNMTRRRAAPGKYHYFTACLLLLLLSYASMARADWPLRFGLGGSDQHSLIDNSQYLQKVIDIEVGPDGSTYVLGEYRNRIWFEREDGQLETISSTGIGDEPDIFVVKYDASGRFKWVKSAGGSSFDYARDLELSVDDTGGIAELSIHVFGVLMSKVNLGGTILNASYSEPRAFIATLREDDDGRPQWKAAITNGTAISDSGAIAHEPNGAGLYGVLNDSFFRINEALEGLWSNRLYISETRYENNHGFQFVGTQLADVAFGTGQNIFVSGERIQDGAPLSDVCETGDDVANGASFVAMLEEAVIGQGTEESYENHTYTCKWVMEIGPADNAGSAYPVLAAAGEAVYVWSSGTLRKYDSFGNVDPNETHTFSNIDSIVSDYSWSGGTSIALDDEGNVYVSGRYRLGTENDTPSIGSMTLPYIGLSGSDSPFVAKLGFDGQWKWLRAPNFSGQPAVAGTGPHMALGISGSVYLGGTLKDFANFIETDESGNISKISTITSSSLTQDGALQFDGNDSLFLPHENVDGETYTLFNFEINMRPMLPGSEQTIFSIVNDDHPVAGIPDDTNGIVRGMDVRVSEDNRLIVYGPQGMEASWDLGVDIDIGRALDVSLSRSGDTVSHSYGFSATYRPYDFLSSTIISGSSISFSCGQYCLPILDPGENGFSLGARLVAQGNEAANGGLIGQINEFGINKWDINTKLWKFDDLASGSELMDTGGSGFDVYLSGSPLNSTPVRVLRDPDLLRILPGSRRIGFLTRLDKVNGDWITPQKWVLGEEIKRPAGNIREEFPQNISIEGIDDQALVNSYFSWDETAGKLYAIGIPTGLVTIPWEDEESIATNPVFALRTGIVVPPQTHSVQLHVADAPVQLDPAHLPDDPGQHLKFESVAWPEDARSAAQQDISRGWVYSRAAPTSEQSEFAVLRYLKTNGPGDIGGTFADREHYYVVTRTANWDHPNIIGDTVVGHPIGSEIIAPEGIHDDPSGGNGFVVFERAPYDGHGPDRAYNRASREGQIIPVNTAGPSDDNLDRLMVVAWYQPNEMGVVWPYTAMRYQLEWPADAPAIVISSLQGTGPLPPEGQVMSSAPIVYSQADENLPGFNPNEEHALVGALPSPEAGAEPDAVVYALRDDLNAQFENLSAAYTLVKSKDEDGDWQFWVYKICKDTESTFCSDLTIETADLEPTYMRPGGPDKAVDPFVYLAGKRVTPPPPLNILGACEESGIKESGDPNQAAWQDVRGNLWARASNGTDNIEYPGDGSTGHTVFQFHYPIRSDFYHGKESDSTYKSTGECIPWLPDDTDTPADVAYEFMWPDDNNVPVMNVGDTLYKPRMYVLSEDNEIAFPTFKNQQAAQVIFDEASFNGIGDTSYQPDTPSLVRLIAPTVERKVALEDHELTELPGDVQTFNRVGRDYFSDLPATLRGRVSYDPINKNLIFSGYITEPLTGDPQVLPNIMTEQERNTIQALSADSDFAALVESLYRKTRNPNSLLLSESQNLDAYLVGLDITPPEESDLDEDGVDTRLPGEGIVKESQFNVPMMLSANVDAGEGYITVALNNHENATIGVELNVLKVSACELYKGNVWVVPSDNVFEEALTLRHSGMFGGDPDKLRFKWYLQPDVAGQPPVPSGSPTDDGWSEWLNNKNLKNDGIDITIEGANITTLSDNWVVVQYEPINSSGRTCDGAPVPIADGASNWAGDPSTYDDANPQSGRAMLAMGWIKRVIAGLNPFDSRVTDFHENEASTISSMVAQAGKPYVAPIPFNPDGDVINSIGLIEAYETILARGRELSIDALDVDDNPAPINDVAANNQLLNVSTRIGDYYMLLGNEAYADAADPTIGFDTSGELGTLASSVFTFLNQLDSPLEEELVMLRGRDDTRAGVGTPPIFNRLFWNFTQGNGEVAYVQSYGIEDQKTPNPQTGVLEFDGFINEKDAAALYPMGHGDAWGHYLTSIKNRYELLRHENFTWVPRTESVLVGGSTIEVDYLDERKFASVAAAKARTGAEIVNLSYRDKYVEDPEGQWQGYKDTVSQQDRAWGLDGWARRAGQGAYFDWLTANAILPAQDPDITHQGIEKIDRTTVSELSQIAAQAMAVQAQVDRADAGLNPIGLAKGVVPFDIDPNFNEVGSGNQAETHFEQIANRAQEALNNAITVFNHASLQTQALRNTQDDVDSLAENMVGQEREFKNRLIEIFGYPYADDPDTPSGYDGPDLYKYMYVSSDLTGNLPKPDGSFTGFYSPVSFGDKESSFYFPGDLSLNSVVDARDVKAITFPVATVAGASWDFVAPGTWGRRRAPGEIQTTLSDLLQAQAGLQRALIEHKNLLADVEDARELVQAEFDLQEGTIKILETGRGTQIALNVAVTAAHAAGLAAARAESIAESLENDIVKGIPQVVGVAVDAFSGIRGAVGVAGSIVANGFGVISDAADLTEFGLELAKDLRAQNTEIELTANTTNVDLEERIRELEQLWRKEPALRLELFTQVEVVEQTVARYYQVLAEGQRILQERYMFRVIAAGDIQEHRYKDMTFRIFRNDALQKYRAHFDLAARYIYLAAAAYDYETSLESNANGSGREFMVDIVRQRTPGQVIDGVPVAGTPGLADVLARLQQNFAVYKGQLGFNNPQTETNRFSMRNEKYKLEDDNDIGWRNILADSYEPDLWDVPEFRRFARSFVAESDVKQPGLVLRFPTTVTFGKNFFDQTLGAGDSAYDSSNFATKVRSVGAWFTDYDTGLLSNTPRIYLFPVLQDVMRTPTNDAAITREWSVVDQKLPVPFPVGASDLTDIDWVPANDSLSDTYADIRRYSSFRAYHDSGEFDESETSSDSRLIGRSVWNNGWVMIIPGGTLLYDSEEGLDRLIYGRKLASAPDGCEDARGSAAYPGAEACRDGNGISDIKLFFQTYGYSGN